MSIIVYFCRRERERERDRERERERGGGRVTATEDSSQVKKPSYEVTLHLTKVILSTKCDHILSIPVSIAKLPIQSTGRHLLIRAVQYNSRRHPLLTK